MEFLKKAVSIVLMGVMMFSVTSCSKYKCYAGTHIPMVDKVVDVEPMSLEDFYGAGADEFRETLVGDRKKCGVECYDDLDGDELMDYVKALISVGFSQNYDASREYGMLFINRQSNYVSAVLILHNVQGEDDDTGLIFYFEVDGYLSDSDLYRLLNGDLSNR